MTTNIVILCENALLLVPLDMRISLNTLILKSKNKMLEKENGRLLLSVRPYNYSQFSVAVFVIFFIGVPFARRVSVISMRISRPASLCFAITLE